MIMEKKAVKKRKEIHLKTPLTLLPVSFSNLIHIKGICINIKKTFR